MAVAPTLFAVIFGSLAATFVYGFVAWVALDITNGGSRKLPKETNNGLLLFMLMSYVLHLVIGLIIILNMQ